MAVGVRADARSDSQGVVALCREEGWGAWGGWGADGRVGRRPRARPPLDDRRRRTTRTLVAAALARAGAERIDVVTDSADGSFRGLGRRRTAGDRLHPPPVAEAGSRPQLPPRAEASDSREAPRVRPVEVEDRSWVEETLVRRWGAPEIVSRGRRHEAAGLEAMVAEVGSGRAAVPVGLATYRVEGDETELVSLDALVEGRGIGTALLAAVAERAGGEGCRRLWLVTSNDNLDALRFYQRRGMRLVAVHRGGVDRARAVKPQIPEVGAFGIALHDEIELELDLRLQGQGQLQGQLPSE